MPDVDGMTVGDLRASTQQLRSVLEAIDSGILEASGRERTFIAGALRAVELMMAEGAPDLLSGQEAC